MSDAPKKRTWFQFHLSTAVVLMFVAGGLMWANLCAKVCGMETWDSALFKEMAASVPGDEGRVSITGRSVYWGWPFAAAEAHGFNQKEYMGIAWTAVAADASVAGAILAATGLLLEWLIRRKERQ
ncbi:MAG: hypothetical protein NTW87_23340 [Planctomycetota bacterium]|nr:hypothetical protein [Planctomycetota bacterium]